MKVLVVFKSAQLIDASTVQVTADITDSAGRAQFFDWTLTSALPATAAEIAASIRGQVAALYTPAVTVDAADVLIFGSLA